MFIEKNNINRAQMAVVYEFISNSHAAQVEFISQTLNMRVCLISKRLNYFSMIPYANIFCHYSSIDIFPYETSDAITIEQKFTFIHV